LGFDAGNPARDLQRQQTVRAEKMVMWESLRAYVFVLLAGAIFIACQVFSGGLSGERIESGGVEPSDRSYRVETTGGGSRLLFGATDRSPLTPAPLYAESGAHVQTD
jgi:hypothetical protein